MRRLLPTFLSRAILALCHIKQDPQPSLTHYVIVRKDLPPGFQAAQIVHAAGESSQGKLLPNTNAVVLSVDNENDLWWIAGQISIAGIAHVLIREVDPPYSGQYTALGIVPLGDRSRVKKIFSKLSLLGAEKKKPGKSGTKVLS